MPIWLPLLKASLPYLTQIVTATLPAFTSKRANEDTANIIPKQIAELQSAVTHNSESMKALATRLKETIEGIDAGAAALHKEMRAIKRFATAASFFALFAAVVAVWALLSKAGA